MEHMAEEFEMNSTSPPEALSMSEVADLLHNQYAIVTGGKSKDGCPLIMFPDNNNFHLLTDVEYQQLMLYLTSVPSLQEADQGFHLVVDRRKDRWNSVKTVLLKISVFFPGLVHVVYVIRPSSFLQKALSEMSDKFFKEEFKFRTIVISSVEELQDYIDPSQLTRDLGGTLPYVHQDWIQRRISLEKFSILTREISNALGKFTESINETEFPNNVDSTQQLLNTQNVIYSNLKEEILSAAKHGEAVLQGIKEKSETANAGSYTPDVIGNVFAIERLLVQLEETESTFDDFWHKYSAKLRHCLELRRFEQDFRELRINFESRLKTVAEMTEVGDNIARIDTLIREAGTFEKLCLVDIERAEEVITTGRQLIQIESCPSDCIEPKCAELIRMRDLLSETLAQRTEILLKCRNSREQIERANNWCAIGTELLSSQEIDVETSNFSELAEKNLEEFRQFLQPAQEIKDLCQQTVTPDTESAVAQAIVHIEDVSLLCRKRIASLEQLTVRPHRIVQTNLPRQPSGGAPTYPNKAVLRKANTVPKMESSNTDSGDQSTHSETDVCEDETYKAKRGHVLTELLETERLYVAELASILTGYKAEALSEEMRPLVPSGLVDNLDVLFGNLDEIHSFHAHVFLEDLERCKQSTDLVALCFVQKRETFFKLYSFYCQNISKSEQLRETMVDSNMFFQACQLKLGHKLPLAAYLLKPVQRITKYQLLLRDLLRFSAKEKYHKELQQALDCMLVVLKCVNDSMHQISITNFPAEIKQKGDLLLQGSFSVWTENKKDIRLRLKPTRRHIFLYQKAMLFCKPASKISHNKATYCFKHYLKMSQIGLTESVRGDARKFEVWLQGRQIIYTIQAANIEEKRTWVNEIKRVLLNQLEELKGEKIKQYSALAQKSILGEKNEKDENHINNHRNAICDSESRTHSLVVDDSFECIESGNWSSDCSVSDDEDPHPNPAVPSARYVALADYCAVSNSEVNMKEGDMVELLKVGCAGWWFVRLIGSAMEGWAPAAYLENLHRKTSRSTSRSQDKLNMR